MEGSKGKELLGRSCQFFLVWATHSTYWALHTVHNGHCILYILGTAHCMYILGTAHCTLETPHCTLQRLHTVWNYFANTFNTIGYHNYDNEVTSKFWLLLLCLLCMIKYDCALLQLTNALHATPIFGPMCNTHIVYWLKQYLPLWTLVMVIG